MKISDIVLSDCDIFTRTYEESEAVYCILPMKDHGSWHAALVGWGPRKGEYFMWNYEEAGCDCTDDDDCDCMVWRYVSEEDYLKYRRCVETNDYDSGQMSLPLEDIGELYD